MKTIQTDVVVIGGGSAGMSAYKAALNYTDNVILVEGDKFGTTCARVGCMPSKLLISAADACYHAKRTDPFGIHINGTVEVNGREVMQRVKAERDRFVGFVLDSVNSYKQEHIVRGWAKFVDEHTIEVDGELRVCGKAFVIATGSRPRVLPQWQVLGNRLQTNDELFEWDDLPESIAVMGTGVTGLEIGQALSHLGVRTELFARTVSIGGITDPVVLEKAQKIFSSGLNIHFNTTPELSLVDNSAVSLEYIKDGKTVKDKVDFCLAAIGRIPNVDNLGLAEIGVKFDQSDVPVFDRNTLQTSVPHIFIAGDASNQLPLLHIASDQGHNAGRNAAVYPNVEAGLVRSKIAIVFSEPQIAMVGKSYRELDLDSTVIGRVDFEDQGRSRMMLLNRGTMRVYFDKITQVFLGAEKIGPAAEHIAHLLAWAHQKQLTVSEMLDMPFYHPVVEEGLRTALREVKAQLV